MKYAVIDIGSNTVRFCAYEKKKDKLLLFMNRSVMALLGSKTENGALTKEGVEAACQALRELSQFVDESGVEKLFVFATAALRNISNTEAVVAEIEEKTGLHIDVLSGEQEALLTYAGASEVQSITDGLIADIGGGSTELVLIKNSRVEHTVSLPIGSLTSFVRFVGKRPAQQEQIAAIRHCVRQMIGEHFSEGVKADILYGIGGATRTAIELEKVLYPEAGHAISVLETLLQKLSKDAVLAETSILKASPKRLDTALPGVAILCEVAAFFNSKRLDICRAGVREGYLQQQIDAL